MKEPNSLRSLGWDRDDHKSNLEERLMLAHGRTGKVVLTRSRALMAAVALVIVGALAGAGSAAAVYEWKGMTIKSEQLDDGSTHLQIHRDGKKVLDEVFDPGEEVMVTDDGGVVVVEKK